MHKPARGLLVHNSVVYKLVTRLYKQHRISGMYIYIHIFAFIGGGLKIEVCVMLATIFPLSSHKADSENVLAASPANVFHSRKCH